MTLPGNREGPGSNPPVPAPAPAADPGGAFPPFTDEGDLVDCPQPARAGRNRFGGGP